jgi:hypothetical protein
MKKNCGVVGALLTQARSQLSTEPARVMTAEEDKRKGSEVVQPKASVEASDLSVIVRCSRSTGSRCYMLLPLLAQFVVGTVAAKIVQSFEHDTSDRHNDETGTQRAWMALTMLRRLAVWIVARGPTRH